MYQKILRVIGKYFETNEQENTTYKNIFHKAKILIGGEFIVPNVYIEKEE